MKKIFFEAEVELTLLSALDDILAASWNEVGGGGLKEDDEVIPDEWDQD